MTVATKPTPSAPRAYHFPRFERRTLENGIQLVVAPIHKLPFVTVIAQIDSGAVADAAGQEGLALLTARALLEGTGSLNADALAEQLELLGTSLDADAEWDVTTLTLSALSSVLPDAFATMAQVITAPSFPAASVERLKGERLAEILHVETEPRELADEQFDRFLYRDGSRYGVPLGGTKASVASLTREHVVAFHAARYAPTRTTIIMAGDVTVDSAETLVRSALGCWQGGTPPAVQSDDTPAAQTPRVHIVHRSDAPQSEIRVGHVGVPRAHPDYFPITVMNAIFGGLFGSRINLNLREAHGYTYGARSAFDWRRQAGPFSMSTAVASNVTAPAVQETLAEMTRMRTELVSESELSLATDYLDGVFPIRFETTLAVADALSVLVAFGLPDDWYDTYRANIRAVTVEDVLRAAREQLKLDQLQIVIVGDASVVREPVAALSATLGVGPVTISDE